MVEEDKIRGFLFKRPIVNPSHIKVKVFYPIREGTSISTIIKVRKKFYKEHYGLPNNEVEWLFENYLHDLFDETLEWLDFLNEETAKILFTIFLVNKNHEKEINGRELVPKEIAYLAEQIWFMNINVKSAMRVISIFKIGGVPISPVINNVVSDFEEVDNNSSIENIITKENLWQINERDVIFPVVQKVLEEKKRQAEEYKSGKTKLFGMFVGQILKNIPMANSEIINELLLVELGKP